MQIPDAADTQPIRTKTSPPQGAKPPILLTPRPVRKKAKLAPWMWALVFVCVLGISVPIGALAGYQSGKQARQAQQMSQASLSLKEQYELGLQDLEAGRYDVARQRFEYVLSQEPTYPGVPEKLAQVMEVLYATATPTPPAPTATPTPTPDPRPIQDLFTQALELVAAQNWNAALDTLVALRKANSQFMTARVDGLMFLSLRQRGVDKILKERNLEGGIYDLALAERFGPLDIDANKAHEWARLYILGLAFWEVYPEQAVYYFSQVAAAAPYLADSSGITATERYRSVLIQYGDQLASQGDWCKAREQYELAAAIRSDDALGQALQEATEQCTGVTPTLPPGSETPTPTSTFPGTLIPSTETPTPTSTQVVQPSATPTATVTNGGPEATATPTATTGPATPTPTETQPTSNTPYPPPALSFPDSAYNASNPPTVELQRLNGLARQFWQKLLALLAIEL